MPVMNPRIECLIPTHIFFGPLIERIRIAGVVKPSSMLIGLRGRSTESICKMWVRIRHSMRGLAERPRADL
jgi:hypothetical protein